MVVYILAYIPPSANANVVVDILLTSVSKLQSAHPDAIFIVAGDFNHANLRTVLPKFQQHVTACPTRGDKTLDHVYINVRGAYMVSAHPHLGQSDHVTLFLTPAYRPVIKRSMFSLWLKDPKLE